MEKRDRARLMAIITEVVCLNGVDFKEGEYTFELIMVITSGDRQGEEIDKRYEFSNNPPDYLRRDLLRLGFLIQTGEELAAISDQLVGMIVRLSLDGDTSRIYIEDYFGRDDPKKYRR